LFVMLFVIYLFLCFLWYLHILFYFELVIDYYSYWLLIFLSLFCFVVCDLFFLHHAIKLLRRWAMEMILFIFLFFYFYISFFDAVCYFSFDHLKKKIQNYICFIGAFRKFICNIFSLYDYLFWYTIFSV
jgi:hypothetical protein